MKIKWVLIRIDSKQEDVYQWINNIYAYIIWKM